MPEKWYDEIKGSATNANESRKESEDKMREVHKEYKTFEDIMEDECVSQVKKDLLRVILFADEKKIQRAVSLIQGTE